MAEDRGNTDHRYRLSQLPSGKQDKVEQQGKEILGPNMPSKSRVTFYPLTTFPADTMENE